MRDGGAERAVGVGGCGCLGVSRGPWGYAATTRAAWRVMMASHAHVRAGRRQDASRERLDRRMQRRSSPARADFHQGADLEEFSAGSCRKWRWRTRCERGRSGAARTAARRPSRRTIAATGWRASSPPRCGRRTDRPGLLDAVLNLATEAIEILIERLGGPGVRLQRGDEKAWIDFAPGPLGLADHAAAARPDPSSTTGHPGTHTPACRLLPPTAAALWPEPTQGVPPGACCGPGRRRSPPCWPRTTSSASRANPESARRTIFTFGQRAWIRPTMPALSFTAPALASMLARRSRAASRCRPQKT